MREPVSREEYRRAFDTIPFSDDFETRTQAMLRCRLQNLEKEESQMTVRKSRKWILAAAVAVAVALLALSVSAAVLWRTPAQVAEEIQDPLLAQAFAGRTPYWKIPAFEMPNGEVLYVEYNKESDTLDVGQPTNAGLVLSLIHI